MSLNLDDIKNFVVCSDTLNVTRASEILGLSQPTLSYSIKRLESELDCDLIIRLKNGIQLTKNGEEFLKRSRDLIERWEETQNIVRFEDEQISGEFSIGVHPSVAIYTLDKIVPVLNEKYPGINLNLIHGLSREMTNKVIDWQLDFGIVVNPVAHPDLVIVELGRDIVTLFKAPRAGRKLIYDPALAQSMFILKTLKKNKINYEGHIHSGNLEVISKLTSTGAGIGLLPSRVAGQYKNLKPIANAPVFKDRICLIYKKERHQNKASQKLLQIFRETKI